MTKEEIQQQIEKLWAEINDCDAIIKRLQSYGASWALDCREMRIAESSKAHAYNQLRKLQQHHPWRT